MAGVVTVKMSRHQSRITHLAKATALALLQLSCTPREESEPAESFAVVARTVEVSVPPRLLRRFSPITKLGFGQREEDGAAELGQKLFFDARLSKDRSQSCASCHDVGAGGSDGKPPSHDLSHNLHRRRKVPTVLNAAGAFAQGWDGRVSAVEEQAIIPLLNPEVMGMRTSGAVIARIREISGYETLFRQAFPDALIPISISNVGRAIGAYERKLATPGRWDSFLRGEPGALSTSEKEGLRTFLAVGCMVCHTGPLIRGTMFERAGVVEPWPDQSDPGRMAITKSEADRMMFKVPTLRNVARTAPYFHDGSAATLPEAVRKMGRHQLGVELTSREVDAITTWLRSLDGDLPAVLVTKPNLP